MPTWHTEWGPNSDRPTAPSLCPGQTETLEHRWCGMVWVWGKGDAPRTCAPVPTPEYCSVSSAEDVLYSRTSHESQGYKGIPTPSSVWLSKPSHRFHTDSKNRAGTRNTSYVSMKLGENSSSISHIVCNVIPWPKTRKTLKRHDIAIPSSEAPLLTQPSAWSPL